MAVRNMKEFGVCLQLEALNVLFARFHVELLTKKKLPVRGKHLDDFTMVCTQLTLWFYLIGLELIPFNDT
jgi:hypothetical protein